MNYRMYLTEDCNLRCKYCYEGEKHTKDASIDNIKALIDYELSLNNQNSYINFYGGEPLLKKDLIYQTIEYIQSKNAENRFQFGVATNGVLMDDEFIEYMNHHRFSLVAFSLDGNKEVQDKNRVTAEGKGTFDVVFQNAQKLLKKNKNVVGMVTATKSTLQQLSESVDFLFSIGFEVIDLQFDYTVQWNDDDMEEFKKQLQLISKLYYQYISKKKNVNIIQIDEKVQTHIYPDYDCKQLCTFGMNNIYVGVDGNFYPCVQFVGMPEFIIGNCQEGVQEEKRNALCKQAFIENVTCKGCIINKRCRHICPCKSYLTIGNINELSPLVCETEKIFISVADDFAEKLYQKDVKFFMMKYYSKK